MRKCISHGLLTLTQVGVDAPLHVPLAAQSSAPPPPASTYPASQMYVAWAPVRRPVMQTQPLGMGSPLVVHVEEQAVEDTAGPRDPGRQPV